MSKKKSKAEGAVPSVPSGSHTHEIAPAPVGTISITSGGTMVSTGGGKWVPMTTPGPHVHTGTAVTPIYGPGGVVGTTTTSGGMVTLPPALSPDPPKKEPKVVEAPTKVPRRILVAFLGENDEIEWCAKLIPEDIVVDFDKSGSAPHMQLGLRLIDAG